MHGAQSKTGELKMNLKIPECLPKTRLLYLPMIVLQLSYCTPHIWKVCLSPGGDACFSH